MLTLLKTEETEEDQEDELSDEHILNVIRRSDEKVLKTAEIAEELPISRSWTGKRLNKLESDGRVRSKSAGRGRVWWLHDSEPSFPVATGIGDLMWYSSVASRASREIILTGLGLFIIGGALLLPILLLNFIPTLSVPVLSSENLGTTAMLAAIGAGMLLILGGALKLVSIALQRHFSIK